MLPPVTSQAEAMHGRATAIAHPNVALVKYWGKTPGPDNTPATPSLSITLDAFSTTTTVAVAAEDGFTLNGSALADAKVARFLRTLREHFELPPLSVASSNDFPTGCGLASSASGFAALVTAIDGAFGLGLSARQRSAWARRGSGSAARSIVGGFGVLRDDGEDWTAEELLPADAWPLNVVIGITATRPKAVGSTAGMERSRRTSPFFNAWLASTEADYAAACEAVAERDFPALARVTESSCLKMHGVALASDPGLLYWNGATVTALHCVRELREAGLQVFFTVDAGPQIKAVCVPDAVEVVRARLAELPGVEAVVVSTLGAGAACTA